MQWIGEAQVQIGDPEAPPGPDVARFLAGFVQGLEAEAGVEAVDPAQADPTHRVRFRFSAASQASAEQFAGRVAADALRRGMAATENPDALGWSYVVDVEPAGVAAGEAGEEHWAGGDPGSPDGCCPAAFVAEGLDGRFAALVELDHGPFGFVQGPTGTTLERAVAWAREQAPRVIVRIGDDRYSAGTERVADLTPLPALAVVPSGDTLPAPRARWRVEARTGWHRADREEVARRIAEAVRGNPAAADTASAIGEPVFIVAFTVSARDEVAAHAAASSVVRAAWSGLGIHATPGEDFDVSGLTVERIP